MIIFLISHQNHNVVTPHLNRLVETVQMRGHNLWFYSELTKICKYSVLLYPRFEKVGGILVYICP